MSLVCCTEVGELAGGLSEKVGAAERTPVGGDGGDGIEDIVTTSWGPAQRVNDVACLLIRGFRDMDKAGNSRNVY